MFFFIIIQKVTFLMTTKNAKKILKLTKNVIYVASSNTHSLVLNVPNHQYCHLQKLKVYCSLWFQFLIIACVMRLQETINL